MSLQELDLFTLQDFFDISYSYLGSSGESGETTREATQEDIDAFYRG